MLTLYTWTTGNGRKATVMLEETELPYVVKPVNIGQGEQFAPAFLAISPNNKIPALVDEEGVDGRRTVFDSSAILIYLAEKSHRLLPAQGRRRDETLQWLMWAATGLTATLGQWNYFARRAEEKVPAAVERFTAEAARLFRVQEKRLNEVQFLAHDYSIADIAAFTWTQALLPAFRETAEERLGPLPATERWLEEIGARPAVRRGMAVPAV